MGEHGLRRLIDLGYRKPFAIPPSITGCRRSFFHLLLGDTHGYSEGFWTEDTRTLDPVRLNEKFRRAWLFYPGGAAATFEAAREVINCCHITFVKGHCARRGTPMLAMAGESAKRSVAA